MTRFVGVVLCTLCAASAAHAGVEIGGTVGAHTFSDSEKLGMTGGATATGLTNSTMFGIRFGVFVGAKIGIEAEGGLIPTEPRMIALFDVYTLAVRGSVVYNLRTEGTIVPFVLGGVGILRNVY